MKYITSVNDQQYTIEIDHEDRITVNGEKYDIDFHQLSEGGILSLLLNNHSLEAIVEERNGAWEVLIRGELYTVQVQDERAYRLAKARGVTAEMTEAFDALYFAMAFAILVVYIVMVLALGSLITPFIILFSLPLAIIGAIPALLITDNPLGISAMIGFLMLIGIVVTNARLNKEQANKVAQMAHDGLARCIRPAHTMLDGDTIFALATGDVPADVNIVGAFGAEVFARAIGNAVRNARDAGGLPAVGSPTRSSSGQG